MSAISTAVSLSRVSAIVGYQVEASLEGIDDGNLPQRIGILAECNNANQSGLPTSLEFTTAKEVGEVCGYGSPAHIIARILRPYTSDVLGSIPTVIYPVAEADSATATAATIAITGTATKNVTHYVKINGREQIDGKTYSFTVEVDDTATEISQKIIDAVNAVLGSPVTGTLSTTDAVLTTKWNGISSAELNVEIDTNDQAAGLTYAVTQVDGAGLPDVADALTAMGEEWTTLLINGIGTDSTTLDAIESVNGNPNDAIGKYLPTVFKPFVALVGSTASTLSAMTAITDSRDEEVTNVVCPAPNSDGWSCEAAANVALIYAPIAQENPQTDPIYESYPDMPTADDIGEFGDASVRDELVKVGCSTVKLNSSAYQIVDLVTTYHPDDEPPTATTFRWVRDLVGVDWNIRYSYKIEEQTYAIGKTIIPDDSTSSASNTISPKRWKSILNGLADDLEDRALIADADYMKETIQVQVGESNPNRFETAFKCQRTGTARVLSTTNKTLFYFGG